jgi:phage gp16-like protein
MDDNTYRAMLANLCGGKTSSKALTDVERQKVLRHFKTRGFVLKRKGGGQTDDGWRRRPLMRKLRALWYLLAEAGAVEHPADAHACDAAIETWAKRQLGDLRELRLAHDDALVPLVEAAKQWARRVGAPVED